MHSGAHRCSLVVQVGNALSELSELEEGGGGGGPLQAQSPRLCVCTPGLLINVLRCGWLPHPHPDPDPGLDPGPEPEQAEQAGRPAAPQRHWCS